LAAYWDWTAGAMVPDARIVVCATSSEPGRIMPVLPWSNGRKFVHCREWTGSERPADVWIPGLHVTGQSEVELKAMAPFFKVKTGRRALLCSPREPIDLRWALRTDVARYNAREDFERHGRWGDCVACPLVDGRQDPRACEFTAECDHQLTNEWVDVVFIVGLDKPMAPAWVRSIVEQCRKAGVPVVFIGWGAYLPESQSANIVSIAERVTLHVEQAPGVLWWCVGAERSGALLDGHPIEDVPAWLGGDHG
jgi:hypothetical protein